jgi:hypothetical protein
MLLEREGERELDCRVGIFLLEIGGEVKLRKTKRAENARIKEGKYGGEDGRDVMGELA